MNTPSDITIIGICNPKSPSNIGAVMRAANCYGAKAVFYTGDRFDRAIKFQTDTKNAIQHIPLTAVDSFLECKKKDTQIVCIELVEGALPLPEFIHPPRAFYIFGPEDGSIEQALIDQADSVVYIPTNTCMNLAATVNVVLYDRMAKTQMNINHTEHIKKIRDTNNRLTIKK